MAAAAILKIPFLAITHRPIVRFRRNFVCTKRSHAGIVFTQWSKNGFFVFRPAGATRCPDKREIWHGGAYRRSNRLSRPGCLILHQGGLPVQRWSPKGLLPHAKSGQKCGNSAPKTCPSAATRLHNFYEIFSICTCL